MKPLHTLAAMMMLAASPLYADEVTRDEYCAGVASLAQTTMSARQTGVSLDQALDIVMGIDPNFRGIVIAAWNEPRYNTPAIQQRVIGDFRDRAHLECLSS